MTVAAWLMLTIIVCVLFGGMAYCLRMAMKKRL